MKQQQVGEKTRAVHGGLSPPTNTRALATPIETATSWRFESAAEMEAHLRGDARRDEYARYGNPTVVEAERRLASLEGTEGALLFSSGMAALSTAFFTLLGAGRHVVLAEDGYRPTRVLVETLLARFGVESSRVPVNDPVALAAAIRPGQTRLVFTESPTNPRMRVPDLAALREVCRAHRGVRLMVDATLATPLLQPTAALGADVVMHSATKFLGGHNDLMAGVLCARSGPLEMLAETRGLLGGCLDPRSAYLLIRGLKTLPLRMRQHSEGALQAAEFLAAHPRVKRVYLPGWFDAKEREIAARQLHGCGGLLAFEVEGGLPAASAVCDRMRLFQHAASLGGAESLVQQPPVISYHDLSAEERAAEGIDEGLVRLSIGLEDPADLLADLRQALET